MIKLWFEICRPRTLFASICPVLIGLLLAEAVTKPLVAVGTLLCAVGLQVLANLINDYYDFKRGSDKAGRVGPQRALAEGLVSERQMKIACVVDLLICVGLGAWLIWEGGWLIALIGVTALLFAWLYTATRHSLSYMGVADIFCLFYYGPVAAGGTAWLQTGCVEWSALLGGCVCGCIAVCVLATNNIRDIEDDRSVGKRTFPVRFGKEKAVGGVGMLLIAAFVLACCTFKGPILLYCLLTVVWSGLNIMLFRELKSAERRAYNKVLFHFGLLNAAYVGLILLQTILNKLL